MDWKTIGFNRIKSHFEKLVEQEILGHAYIFAGQDMIGKRTFAFEFAKKIGEPADFLSIDRENEESPKISIEDSRHIKNFVSTSPAGPYKIIAIDDAHQLTNEAANSLLKILEEPPRKAVFILITSQSHELPPTIISRCQTINFNPHSTGTVGNYLKGIGLNEGQILFLREFMNGRIGLVKKLSETGNFAEIKEAVHGLQKIVTSPIHERLNEGARIAGEGRHKAIRTVLYWLLYLHSPLSAKLGAQRKKMLRMFLDLHYELNQPSYNHRLLFESALARI